VIATAVGYSRPGHFTRAFSRIQGVSPKAYRQRAQTT
jgi:AraC-like DNA-binding protein